MSTHRSPPPGDLSDSPLDLASSGGRVAPPPSAFGTQPPLSSRCLLAGQPFVKIEHNGAVYELRATRLGKLILTK